MSEWKPKRFWTAASIAPEGDGFTVLLDGRKVKTPAKASLIVPSEALAQEIAAEWDAQEGVVDPTRMPFTRSANAAIDKVAHQMAEVAGLIAAYGDSDLLCYRAEEPAELVARQAQGWDPLLDWARDGQNLDLQTVSGLVHRPQKPEALAMAAALTQAMDAFQLTAFHDLVGLSGSFVLGLAATRGFASPETLWALSRIDETWQEEQWGTDDEAAAFAEGKRQAFLHAARFYFLTGEAAPGG
ncbi:ATP12 family chaperone protein [Marimonas arenosa]|uniref:ATPase n=1 Tax=Marimonas arenosa TaxID=1795305 RepID=A0AAE4B675_9RHOB|nr:ATP12 family protein [Marimonas arenosa]MDQ2091912.1 ATPase [Marimonas arenosa]